MTMAITHIPPGGDFFGSEHAADHRSFGFTGSAAQKPHSGEGTYVGRGQASGRRALADGGPATPPAPQQMPQPQMPQAGAGTPRYDGGVWGSGGPAVPPATMAKGGRARGRKHLALGGTADAMPGGPPSNQGATPQQQGGPLSHATLSMPADQAIRAFGAAAQMGKAAGARQAVGSLASIGARMRAQAQHPAMGAAPGATSALMGARPPTVMPPGGMVQGGPPPQQPMMPTPGAGQMPGGVAGMAHGGHITAAQRHALPAADFALPGEHYPIDTPGRARSALSRGPANASKPEQATIRRKVHAKYPNIGQK
jgi:hypothetical protein